MAKITGKAGTVTINGNPLNFTEFDTNVDRVLANTTDNLNYDVTTDLLWSSQLPVSDKVVIDLKGWYDTATTASALMAILFSGALAQPVIVKFTGGVTFGHGFMDISNFKTSNPVDNTVNYSVTFTSNGVFVQGS